MIEQVENLNKKSFRDYTGPHEKFKSKNIIFGYNGRGKSSLALGVRDRFLELSPCEEDNLRFFNKNYVDDNLRLRDQATGACSENKIKGVEAQFSKKAIDNEDAIKNLNNQKINTETIQQELDKIKIDTRKDINAIHDRRKGTASISRKNKEYDIDKIIELYNEDYNNAKKIEPDVARLSKIEGNNAIEEKIKLINTIVFEGYYFIGDEEITKASNIFKLKFNNINIPSSEIVEWLNDGISIHKNSDKCHFCGGSLSLYNVQKRVEEYNANEKQKAVKFLKEIDTKLIKLQSSIKGNLDRRENVKMSLEVDNKIDFAFTDVEESSVGIANARIAIEAKIKNMDNEQNFIDFRYDLNKFNNAIETLTDIKTIQLAKLEIKNNNKNTLVKGAIGYEVINSTVIKGKLSYIESKTKELKKASITNKRLNEQVQELKQAESVTSDFANYISSILTSLDIHLKLIVSEDGKNYTIQHTHTSNDLTIADISEGERNLLALLFFYYELFNDSSQKNFKDTVRLIVVDDPISSMDDINKTYITELMRRLLELKSPQVFILTHSWSDFTNLCYGYADKPDDVYGLYEIKKDISGNSLIQKTKSNISPYNHNFIEVYEFSKKTNDSSFDDCDVYHTPNIIRQVLEGFLSFKIKKSNPTKKNKEQIAKVLFREEWTSLKEDKKTKLCQFLTTININSHSSSRNTDEILNAAKFLMTYIKQADPQHFNTYKESIK